MALYLLVRMCPLLTEQICFILFFRSFECSEMKWLFFFKGQWLQLGASWMFLLTGMNQHHMWGADSVFYFISFSHLSESERESLQLIFCWNVMLGSQDRSFKVKTAPKLSFGIFGVHVWNSLHYGCNYPHFSRTSVKCRSLAPSRGHLPLFS